MKKLILVLMLILCLGLVGCTIANDIVVANDIVSKDDTPRMEMKIRFIDTGDTYSISDLERNYKVVYDSKTKIVYLVSIYQQGSGITVMYNNEGKPMTIDEYNTTK